MTENEELKLGDELNGKKCDLTEEKDDPHASGASNFLDKTVHNIDNLKSIDFNSADEVRQKMKEIFGQGLKFDDTAEDNINIRNAGDHESEKKLLQKHLMTKDKETDDPTRDDDHMISDSNYLRCSTKNHIGTSRKRPGRPPKAGPSRKLKKQSVSSMYLGKLTNVVFLKRIGSSNVSDIESLDLS
ncbi:hypothetical protein KGM_208528 [Danaus plexippus plexippus]|uniref:Uncharacterized protein n=1 Tax=Danaus plexippus plexippus TaxID=278856 RepID=A0A212EIB2_DANPL|nr:hypothetical protein KGM_208528 [Danaus plexippus plexippus]